MTEWVTKAVHLYHDAQIATAVFVGALIQVMLGSKKNARRIAMVGISSIFVAIYIVAPIVEMIGVEETSKAAIAMYALSSLISIEIIGVVQTVLPRGIKAKMTEFLGVENDTTQRK